MENETLKRIKNWMENNLRQYIDECGEINYTKMSEDANVEFDIGESDEEEIFTLASEFEII